MCGRSDLGVRAGWVPGTRPRWTVVGADLPARVGRRGSEPGFPSRLAVRFRLRVHGGEEGAMARPGPVSGFGPPARTSGRQAGAGQRCGRTGPHACRPRGTAQAPDVAGLSCVCSSPSPCGPSPRPHAADVPSVLWPWTGPRSATAAGRPRVHVWPREARPRPCPDCPGWGSPGQLLGRRLQGTLGGC